MALQAAILVRGACGKDKPMEKITFAQKSLIPNIILAMAILLIQLGHKSKITQTNFENQRE
jgi:hypothetical protein